MSVPGGHPQEAQAPAKGGQKSQPVKGWPKGAYAVIVLLCMATCAYGQGGASQAGAQGNPPGAYSAGAGCGSGGTCNPSSFNGVIEIDGLKYTTSPDIGTSINTAYANLPANGGKIVLPPGSFNFSTPLSFTTANKPVILEGSGSWATQLTYTGALSSTAITFNNGAGNSTNHPRGAGLRNLTIVGPGSGSTGIGLLIGSTVTGAEGFRADGINIGGFNQVVVYGTSNAWATLFINSIIRNGVTNLLSFPSGGIGSEQAVFVNTTFIQDQIGAFANCIVENNGADDVMFSNVSVDNCQISLQAGNFEFDNIVSYWLVAQSSPLISITGSANASGSSLHLINTSSSTTAGSVISMTAGVMNINGIAINSTGYTFPVVAALSNGAQMSVFGTQSGGYTTPYSTTTFTGSIAWHNLTFPSDNFVFGAGASDADIQIQNFSSPNGQSWAFDSLSTGNLSLFPKTNANALLFLNGTFNTAFTGGFLSKMFEANQGSVCTNGELALSANWAATGSASVTAVAGRGQTCSWTITTGTTTGANPTVTDTLTNSLNNAGTRCWMFLEYGPASTHTAAAGEGFAQTTLSATAPIFTFNGTPTAAGKTYLVVRTCGP